MGVMFTNLAIELGHHFVYIYTIAYLSDYILNMFHIYILLRLIYIYIR